MAPQEDDNGNMYNFVNSGLYDALFVIEDQQTKSLWNHFTGEAMYGPHVSDRMQVSNLMQMNVSQALAMDPTMTIAISDWEGRGDGIDRDMVNMDFDLSDPFSVTLGIEDDRRPRMEMGLGVWIDDEVYRFYPSDVLRENGRIVLDQFGDQSLIVYLDPVISVPVALFVDADSASVEGADVVLDDGRIIRDSVIYDAEMNKLDVARPLQVFTRWYGFVMSFGGDRIDIFE